MCSARASFSVLLVAGWLATGTVWSANFVVTTAADSGLGSLRDALVAANGNAQPDLITFTLLPSQPIVPLTALPNLTEPGTTIDGDANADCVPEINLSGALLGPNNSGLQVAPSATATTVRGLAIYSFSRNAIGVSSSGGTYECNHFGTDVGGVAVLPNGGSNTSNVFVTGSGNTIGPGNRIVNSPGVGVRVSDGNLGGYPGFVGLSSDSPPRVYSGVNFSEVCGSVNGNGFVPVDGTGQPFTENYGIRLRGRVTITSAGSYTFDFPGLDDQARVVLDGGTFVADLGAGGPTSVSTMLGAGAHPIEIAFRENVGGSRLSLAISGPAAATLSSDDQALCATGQAGLCAELFQQRVASSGNRITRNRHSANGGLGLQMSACGPYPNDVGDADVGPNGLLNSPVITSLTALGADFNVIGTAPANSIVELFRAAPDPSGHGEGETFVAQTTTSAGGNFSIIASLPPADTLTATATDVGNNTSEFGRNFSYSTGAARLFAAALSTSSIRLTWFDPNLTETGFRVERSTDGTAYTTAATLGANAASHVDTSLAANTLYYYRVIATTGAGDAPASNRATTSTFPATAAQVCFERIPRSNGFTLNSTVQFDGTAWAVAWTERSLARDNIDLLFRRFAPATLAPVGPVVTISDADMNIATPPRMAWNGTNHAVVWSEAVRGAAGSTVSTPLFFALLDVNGQTVRGNVRVSVPQPYFEPLSLHWDGSHWGLFGYTTVDDPLLGDVFFDLFFQRLTLEGRPAGAPIFLTSTAMLSEFPLAVAWSPERDQYGVTFVAGRDGTRDWMFQRFSSTGTAIDAVPRVFDSVEFLAGQFAVGSLSALWDGNAWAVAYSRDDPASQVESAVYLRRFDGTSGAPLGAASTRLSDDTPADASDVIAIHAKPGGGYAVFASSSGAGNQPEVTRMQATAAGLREGSRVFVTPNDGQGSARAAVGGSGSEFLVTYTPQNQFTLPSELSGVRIAADGASAPLAPVALTSGHDVSGGDFFRATLAASVGDGFVAVWNDGPTVAPRLNARIWNGTGQIVSTLTPLTATSSRGPFGLVGVGNSFALAWKNSSNDVIFARYNASGGSITGERTLASAVGGQANIALGWSGEHYAVFYAASGPARFVRVDAAGDVVGSPVTIARGPDAAAIVGVQWLGDSWALVTRTGAPNGSLDYVRYGPDGALLDGPVTVATPVVPLRGARSQQLHYTGQDLGLSWTNWAGADPPSEFVYFTVLERDGSKRFPEVAVVDTGLADNNARLYSIGDNFRVIANQWGFSAGLREFEVTPTGTVLPSSRALSHRSSGLGIPATAFNGATTGILYFPSGAQHLYFQTTACLADATPAPCPTLSTMFANDAVETSWSAVSDAQSGIARYVLYRDGAPLAELDPDRLDYADGGYDSLVANVYEVRALNGAFLESIACPTQTPNLNVPTIVAPPNQTIAVDGATGELPVTIGDVETPAASLLLGADSSDPGIVPNAGITLAGTGSNRTVAVAPAPGATGTVTLTLTVDDGSATATDSFDVVVLAAAIFANGFESP